MKAVVPMKQRHRVVESSSSTRRWVAIYLLWATTITISFPRVQCGTMRQPPPPFADRSRWEADFLRKVTIDASDHVDRDFQKKLLSMATPVKESKFDLHRQLNNKYNDDGTGIDLMDYAIKYVGCQNVHTFSDNKAKDASSESVFVMNRFVILRLCPADYCSNYHAQGCQFGYGEYVIAMEDYLSAMARYHYVRYQSFCETCDECMNPENAGNDDYGKNNNGNRALNNDDGKMWSNASATNETDYSYCEYYEVCSNYKDACKYYSSSAEQYEKFFSCTANPYSNNRGYLGPHCRSDGYTIGIGLYTDNVCGDFVGDMKTIEQYTGIYFNDSVLEVYADKSCISCKDADEFDLYTDDAHGDSLYQLCGVLWDGSAKCNKHMEVSDESATYESSQQAANADLVCEFIDSLVEKTYDEKGHIILKSESFDIAKWRDKSEYTKFVQNVKMTNRFELAGVALSVLLCLFLVCYSWYLRRKLYQRLLWRPSPPRPGGGASVHTRNSLSRINSGITMGRSFSGEMKRGVLA